jgi:hypothetical protein
MKNYTQYHDGFFDGLWRQNEGIVQVYLRTSEKERTTVVLTGVVMLKVMGFKTGNIIFEVLTRHHDEITLQDIAELYDLKSDHEPAKWEHELLEKARQEDFQIFELNPSYGGSCLILARTTEFVNREEWAERYARCEMKDSTQRRS